MKETFDLEETRLRDEIARRGAKRILIQLPEGLKPEAPRLAAIAESTGATAIVSADPCYGACDLALPEAEILGVDLLVHYGHSEMPMDRKTPVPVVYIEAKANIEAETVVEKAIDLLKPWNKIGLATTVQHVHVLSEAKQVLSRAGKTVHIGDTRSGKYPGQVLGCDYSNAKAISDNVEAFVFIGGGRFHALGLFLATMKPTVVADPFEGRVYLLEAEAQKAIRKRWSNISEAKEAKNFAILVGLKTGQSHIDAAIRIKEDLEKSGKNVVLLALREIAPAALSQFPTIEAYIDTACPRIALDDSANFGKPVLTLREAHMVLGRVKWEDLLKNGFV